MTETHMTKDETATFVIEGQKVTVTAQQLLGLKQAERIDPDEKYLELLEHLRPELYPNFEGRIIKTCMDGDQQCVTTQLSAQRVRTYIKLLNIAAKLNGESDWNNSEGDEAFCIIDDCEKLVPIGFKGLRKAEPIKFKTEALALEALTYLNSEDKIAMFGCDKVKED